MKWNTNHIRDLLDRYWEGDTTLAEERLLKEFFRNEPLPDGFEKEASLFRALLAEQAVQMPATRTYAIPQRRIGRYFRAAAAVAALLLTAGAWWWLAAPQPGASRPLAQTAPARIPAPRLPTLAPLPETPPAAASERVAVLPQKAKPKKRHNPQPQVIPESIDDPEAALAEIRAALALVSSKIKKGKKEMDKGLQEIETLDKVIKKKNEG